MVKKKMTIDDLAALMQRTMASKEDLERFATKEDLERFATKEDLAQLRSEMATKLDMEAGFFAVNTRIDQLRDDLSDLPDIREELVSLDDRLTHVERKVGVAR